MGWGVAALIVCALFAIARSARLSDAFLWRVEQWQSAPTVSQRIFERRAAAHLFNVDRLVPPGAVLFFGDSHLQTLPVGGLTQAYNFAIGGETAQRLSERLGRYTSLPSARAVVIGAGTNDLFEGRSIAQTLESWEEILGQLPVSVKVVCVEIPLNRAADHAAQQDAFNRQLARLCGQRGHSVVSLPQGDDIPMSISFSPDGVHLDAAGSKWLLERIERVLK